MRVLPTCSHSAGSIEYLKWHRPTHPTSPSPSHGLALSPRGVSLISHFRLSPAPLLSYHSNPSTHHLALSRPPPRARPPYLYPLTLPFLALPTARVVLHHTPIFRQFSRALPLFLSPSSSTFLLPFPAFRPYELSTGAIPMDKSGNSLLSTSCSTDHARIPTNRNAGELWYRRHGALRRLHAKCGQTGTRREKYIDTL